MANSYPKFVSAEVKDALDHFYHHSNASSIHNDHETDDEYFAGLFTNDGVYDFMGRRAKGSKEIIALREALFKETPHRDHPLVQIFTDGSNDLELMGLGTVAYGPEDQHSREWAGRYSLVKTGDGLKFKEVKIIGIPPTGA